MANDEIGYTTIRLPDFLINQIDKVVSDKGNGFRSRNEFCVDAIRRILRKYRNNVGGVDADKKMDSS